MAIYRPRTIGDAPDGPERSGGCCRRDFLASRGMGVSPGEESRVDSVAAQTIEAQPVFGQIEPSQRPGASRADTQSREKRWLISVVPFKGLELLGVEKEAECGNGGLAAQRDLREKCPSTSMRSGTNVQPVQVL